MLFIILSKIKYIFQITLKFIFDKIENSFRKIQIKTRLITSLILISTLPLIITGLLLYSYTSSAIEEKIKAYSSQLTYQVAQNIELNLNHYEGLSVEVAISENIRKILDSNLKLSPIEEYDNRKIGLDLMSEKFKPQDSISYAAIYKNNKMMFDYGPSNTVLDSEILNILEESTKLNTVFWNVTPSGKIYLSRPILSLNFDKTTSYFIMFLKHSIFENILKDVDFGKSSNIYIFDIKGNIVTSTEENITSGSILKDNLLLENTIKNDISNNKIFLHNDSIITFKNLKRRSGEKINIFFVTSISNSYINEKLIPIRNVIIVTILIIIIVGTIISLLISLSISSPLNNLVKLMKKARDGKFELDSTDQSTDEIGVVYNSYKEMLKNIHKLVSKVSKTSLTILESAIDIRTKSRNSNRLSELISKEMKEISKVSVNKCNETKKGLDEMYLLFQKIEGVKKSIYEVSKFSNSTISMCNSSTNIFNEISDKSYDIKNINSNTLKDIKYIHSEIRILDDLIKSLKNQDLCMSINNKIVYSNNEMSKIESEKSRLKYLSDLFTITSIISTINDKSTSILDELSYSLEILEKQISSIQNTENVFYSISNSMKDISISVENIQELIHIIISSGKSTIFTIEQISVLSEEDVQIVENISSKTHEQMNDSHSLNELADELSKMSKILSDEVSIFNQK